jgi:hypothetical protein
VPSVGENFNSSLIISAFEKGNEMNHRHIVVGYALALASLLTITSQPAWAADNATTDPTVLAAQQAQAMAEARKAIAEADLAAAKARLGSVTQPLPSGSGTATTLNIEGKILAYRAADKAADQIATAIIPVIKAQEANKQKIVFLSAKEVANVSLLQAFNEQAALLLAQVPKLVIPSDIPRPCPKPAPPKYRAEEFIAPGVAIDAGLTLLRLFKTDRTLVGEDVTLDDFAIVALLAGKLGGYQLVYPPSYFPDAFGSAAAPQVYETFNKLLEAQFTVANLQDRIAIKKQEVADRKKQAEKDEACQKILDADAARLDALSSQASVFKDTLTQVNAALTKTADPSGIALIQSLALAERLATNMKGALLLQVKAVAAGGTTHTSTNIFGSSFSFSGGAIVSYVLYTSSGLVARAGTIPAFAGLFKDEKINDALADTTPKP